MRFEQSLTHRDVSIYDTGRCLDFVGASFTVEWELDMEYRTWGVKHFGSNVLDVRGDYQLPEYDSHSGEVEAFTDHQFTLEGYKIINDIALTEHGQMMVSEVEIDLTNKTVLVS